MKLNYKVDENEGFLVGGVQKKTGKTKLLSSARTRDHRGKKKNQKPLIFRASFMMSLLLPTHDILFQDAP